MRRAAVARAALGNASMLGRDLGAHTNAPSVQTVIDQQGTGRVTHKPDGSIVWEPLPDRAASSSSSSPAKKVLDMLDLAARVALVMSGAIAAVTTAQHMDKAYQLGTTLTSGQLTRAVAQTVASSLAGMMAGMVLGPAHAVAHLAVFAAKPALGGLLVHRGVVWARRHLSGTVGLVRGLQSGKLWKQLEVLRCIIGRALKNDAFRRDFARYSGIELLLRLLSDALSEAAAAAAAAAGPGTLPSGAGGGAACGPQLLLQLQAQALEALLRSQECRDICVGAGGVPLITSLLRLSTTMQASSSSSGRSGGAGVQRASASPPRMRRSGSSSSFSSYGSCSAAADSSSSPRRAPCYKSRAAGGGSSGSAAATAAALQGEAQGPGSAAQLTQLALSCLSHLSSRAGARDAVRESGGLPVLVRVLALHPTCSPQAAQALNLLQDLCVDPAAKDAVGEAGGVQALLEVVKAAAPKSQVQSSAIATLHTLLRGSPGNQAALAQLPGSFMYLHSCHAGLGASWHPCKAELHDIFDMLSRFPQDMPCHTTGIAAASRKPAAPARRQAAPAAAAAAAAAASGSSSEAVSAAAAAAAAAASLASAAAPAVSAAASAVSASVAAAAGAELATDANALLLHGSEGGAADLLDPQDQQDSQDQQDQQDQQDPWEPEWMPLGLPAGYQALLAPWAAEVPGVPALSPSPSSTPCPVPAPAPANPASRNKKLMSKGVIALAPGCQLSV